MIGAKRETVDQVYTSGSSKGLSQGSLPTTTPLVACSPPKGFSLRRKAAWLGGEVDSNARSEGEPIAW